MVLKDKEFHAPINKIIPLSSVDGPGSRTSIFLQRCNIACVYCHNPETQKMCINCGICVAHCPVGALSMVDGKVKWDDKLCIQCDACINSCPHFSTPKIKTLSPEEVMAIIRPNKPYIRGITVSGGECSLYPDFLTKLFELAHQEGLTCLMDSNGMVDLSRYPELLKNLDGVMLDVKAWEQPVYQRLTKASNNNLVKKNLTMLAERGLLTEIRIVNVPDYVDTAETIAGIAETIGDYLTDIPLKLIAFRNFGVKGLLANHRSPSQTEMATLKQQALAIGYKKVSVL